MPGHSGGGYTVRDIVTGTSRPKNLTGIILFDAEAMAAVVTQRVTEDMAYLTDPADVGRTVPAGHDGRVLIPNARASSGSAR